MHIKVTSIQEYFWTRKLFFNTPPAIFVKKKNQ